MNETPLEMARRLGIAESEAAEILKEESKDEVEDRKPKRPVRKKGVAGVRVRQQDDQRP